MREHMGLYRGKRIDNGEWVEGFYHRVTNNWTHENVHYITCLQDMPLTGETILTGQYEVNPDTVGEATGRKFKDKMCFEGDIIFARHSRLLVGWDYDYSAWLTYYFDDMGNPRRFCPLHDIALWETDGIIGNIHDNPELLKGGEGE